MGCFKLVLDKLKRDVQKKMGNLSAVKVNDEKFERLSEKSSDKSCKDFGIPTWLEEANNPRVAMDFTNGVGRVVSDPEEVAQIYKHERWGAQYRPTR
ncbi:hypothetical protein GWI33_000834 [Rhynchophorus ferrugineus]|uniref:Uncharacterized protein n=1 Tax=Rhynchophorus ferrugineus TaxID=354439 RepID=A0A834MI87_RHYFE|nr:hypothetical protein GWI33_000834 [Rhynchophorus ferrugineus]